MSEMVERVARALFKELSDGASPGNEPADLSMDGKPALSCILCHDAVDLNAAAKAAIDAMRAPTEVMTDAAREARIFIDELQILETESEEIWKAMIAAALEETTK